MAVTHTKHRILLHGKSDIGMVREENQDSFRVHVPRDAALLASYGQLAVLADGMGGLAHGGRASQIAVETVCEVYFKAEGDPAEALVGAAESANSEIFKEAQVLPGNQPMGSTLTAMVFLEDSALIAQVGDSRAYRISREDGIRQLTHDHTLVQELADRGEIEPDSLHYLLNRNVLTRGLGLQDDVEVDLFNVGDITVGDTFLLCSDGLYDVVADSEIESHALSYGSDTEGLVSHLIELARSRGAPDNVTIVVAKVEEDTGGSAAPRGPGSAAPVDSAEEVARTSMATPILLFLAFALGAALTLLFQKSSGPESDSPAPRSPSATEAAQRLLDDPRTPPELRAALEGFLESIDARR